ncbi:MAG TPA: hypothetical protein VGC56_16275 [Allosphingosinicella sp.]|jgi:hypothetical protein
MGNTTTTAVAPASPPDVAVGQHGTQTTSAHESQPEPTIPAGWIEPISLLTLWLAIATTGLVIYTARLWRATTDLAKDAKSTSDSQAEKMERSIQEAARAAKAMEGVAGSMAVNAAQIVRSVEITEQMAETQREFSKIQMRAYVAILIGGGLYQDRGLRFQADPLLVNRGNTVARHVRFKIAADVLPIPLPDTFKYPLPKEWGGGNILDPMQDGAITAIAPGRVDDDMALSVKNGIGDMGLYVWGVVEYMDVFKQRHRRTFAQRVWWIPSAFDGEGNPTGWQVRGLYLPDHNRGN